MSIDRVMGMLALNACLAEVHAAPKPGLVDRLGPGSHRDMDHLTFLISASALAPFWEQQALVGLTGVHPTAALAPLRKTGLRMDSAMFASTGGVNTHKGLVFALSLLLYGAGYAIFNGERPGTETSARYASMAVEHCCARELEPLETNRPDRPLSAGERLFLEHGMTGIRGEAERGFPSVTTWGLPAFEKAISSGASRNDAALFCLFRLMKHGEDTNIAARMGYGFWKHSYPDMVEPLLHLEPPFDSDAMRTLHEADRVFSELGVSPGGAADLLTCTIWLHDADKLFCNRLST